MFWGWRTFARGRFTSRERSQHVKLFVSSFSGQLFVFFWLNEWGIVLERGRKKTEGVQSVDTRETKQKSIEGEKGW